MLYFESYSANCEWNSTEFWKSTKWHSENNRISKNISIAGKNDVVYSSLFLIFEWLHIDYSFIAANYGLCNENVELLLVCAQVKGKFWPFKCEKCKLKFG